MMHALNKHSQGGNVVLKIDMAKAYNNIDWNFLLHVLCSLGFLDVLQDYLIMYIFTLVLSGNEWSS